MAISQAAKDAVLQGVASYEIKVYIEDDNDLWVDFSARARRGQNRLIGIGDISHGSELALWQYVTQTSNIKFDNSDGFFNRPFPLSTDPDALITLKGSAADFSNSMSKNYQMTVLRGHRIRFSVLIRVPSEPFSGATTYGRTAHDSVEEQVIGTFMMDSCAKTFGKEPTVSVKIKSFSKIMSEKSVETVKNGTSWYENRPTRFLIEQILRLQWPTGIPDSFHLEPAVDMPLPSGERICSIFGPPPQMNTTTPASPVWETPTKIGRTVCVYSYGTNCLYGGTNTIQITGGSSTVISSSSSPSWYTHVKVGDAFYIKDSAYGGSGGYIVQSFVSSLESTQIVLNRPVSSQDGVVETGISYCVTRYYIGCDNELWFYNPVSDEYKQIDISAASLPSDVRLTNLFTSVTSPASPSSPYSGTDKILWGVALTDEGANSAICTAYVISVKINETTPTVTQEYTNASVFAGRWLLQSPCVEPNGSPVVNYSFRWSTAGILGQGRYGESLFSPCQAYWSVVNWPQSGEATSVFGSSWVTDPVQSPATPFTPSYTVDRYNLDDVSGFGVNPLSYSVYHGRRTDATLWGDTAIRLTHGTPVLSGTYSPKIGSEGSILFFVGSDTVFMQTSNSQQCNIAMLVYDIATDTASYLHSFVGVPLMHNYMIVPTALAVSDTSEEIYVASLNTSANNVSNYTPSSLYGYTWHSPIHRMKVVTNSKVTGSSAYYVEATAAASQTAGQTAADATGYTRGYIDLVSGGSNFAPGDVVGIGDATNYEVHRIRYVVSNRLWFDNEGMGPNDAYTIDSLVYTESGKIVGLLQDCLYYGGENEPESLVESTYMAWTIVDMLYLPDACAVSGNPRLLISMINRWGASSTSIGECGALALHSHSTASDTLTPCSGQYRSQFLFRGLCLGSKADGGGTYRDVYMIDTSAGTLLRFDASDSSGAVVIENVGSPAVETEAFNASRLVADEWTRSGTVNHDIILGISAPALLPEMQQYQVDGKYYLWKYDSYVTDRIELADFSGMKGQEAISSLAQIPNYTGAFDEYADFVYVPRPRSSTIPDYTFSVDSGLEKIIGDVSLDDGISETFNWVQMVPSYGKLGDISADLILIRRARDHYFSGIPGPDNQDQPNFANMEVEQRDKSRKTVRAICTQSGSPFMNNDTHQKRCRFKYTVTQNAIDVTLVSSYTSGTTVSLNSVYNADATIGVNAGDLFSIDNPSTLVPITRAITAVSASANTITIESAITEADFGVGSRAKIYKAFRRSATVGDFVYYSNDGVTYLTAAVTSTTATSLSVYDASNISVGTILSIDSNDSSGYVEEMLVTNINYDTNVVTVARGVAGTTATTHSNNAVVKAYFAPGFINGEVLALEDYMETADQEIGHTGVWCNFAAEKWDDHGLANSLVPDTADPDTWVPRWTSEFLVGDMIIVECSGMQLQQNSEAKRTATNAQSVAQYGLLEFSGNIDNKFAGNAQAYMMVQRLIDEYAFPKWHVSLSSTGLFWLTLFNSSFRPFVVAIRSHKMFPMSQQHTEYFYIRKVSHNPMTNKSSFELAGIENY